MKTKSYLIVSTLIFALVALAHLIRVALDSPVMLGAWNVPIWVAAVAVLVSAGFALWGLTLVRRT